MTEAATKESTEFAPGTFCWVELGTSNAAGAKEFYAKLFDWEYTDNPMGPDMVYSIPKLNGKDVGGLYQLMPDMVSQGVTSHWMSYVLVKSADESAAKAKELGAELINGPFDVSTMGRMAVLKDPTGAVFSLWQAGANKGSGIANVPGSFCWNELGTGDTTNAAEFYTGLFGWTANTQNFGDMEYTMFQNGERPAGGMYKLTPEMGNVPPHWLVYFAVDDCDAKVAAATSLGAQVMKPADDIPGIGRFAILIDPQGAAFALIKLDGAPA
jgi:uncharacterized protein